MIGFDARWLGLPLMVAMFMVIFIWVYVSVRYVSRIESLLSNSSMVSGNKKIFGHAGLLGKVMRTGSASVMLSMRAICIRKGLLDLQDVKRGGLRFQVQQSVDNVEPIGCQQLQMIRQHFNREFPAQCLTRSGVEQVGNLVQPLLANQRQIGALG